MKDLILSVLAVLIVVFITAVFCWGAWLLLNVLVFEPILKFLYIFAGGAALS